MSLGLCRLSKSAETNALAPVSGAHERSTKGEMPSGLLDLWMSKEDRTPLTVFWLNLTLGIKPWHRGTWSAALFLGDDRRKLSSRQKERPWDRISLSPYGPRCHFLCVMSVAERRLAKVAKCRLWEPKLTSSGGVALKLLADFGDMLGPYSDNLPLKESRSSVILLLWGFHLCILSNHCLGSDLICLAFAKTYQTKAMTCYWLAP